MVADQLSIKSGHISVWESIARKEKLMKQTLTAISAVIAIMGLILTGCDAQTTTEQLLTGTAGISMFGFGCFSITWLHRK